MSALEKRIRSRCCRLLELRYTDKNLGGWSSTMSVGESLSIGSVCRSSVTYLHRTVAEFITTKALWQDLSGLRQDVTFDACVNLCSACLSTLKSANQFGDRTLLWYLMTSALFCRIAAKMPLQLVHKYLLETDRTMSNIQEGANTGLFPNRTYWRLHWSANSPPSAARISYANVVHHASIYTFAARAGLFCHRILVPSSVDSSSRFAIVLDALANWTEEAYGDYALTIEQKTRTMSYLLRNPVSPETTGHATSLWKEVLKNAVNRCREVASRSKQPRC